MRSKTGFAWPFSAFMERLSTVTRGSVSRCWSPAQPSVDPSASCQSDSYCHDRAVAAYTSVGRQSWPASVCAHLLVLICSKQKSWEDSSRSSGYFLFLFFFL